MPTAVRDGLAGSVPGLSADKVRVLVGDVGGGFGMKTGIYPEDVAVAFAAWRLKRPVKWQSERLEEFLAAVHGRDLVSRAEMALDAQGRVLALRVRSLANVGAYPSATGVLIQLLIGPWVATSIYDIPLVDMQLTAVLTNCMPTGAYRGAGRPEAIYITERLMDAAAREMRIDPAEMRRRNMIRPGQMPYTNPMGQVYDCGQFEKILDQGLALSDWAGFAARRQASKARGRLRGRGIATFLEWTSGMVFEEKVSVAVTPDGFIAAEAQRGLTEEVVRNISRMKGEPEWMLEFRLKALAHFKSRPMPKWGPSLDELNLDEIYYYVKPTEKSEKSWEARYMSAFRSLPIICI